MITIWEYLLVFVFAAIPWIEIAVVIPLAIIRGLNPLLVGILAFIGNMITVYLLILFFEKYCEWYQRRKGEDIKNSKRAKRGVSIWNKYGLPGLALLGPLLVGSHLAAIIGMILGGTKRNTLQWITISLVIWTLALTVTTHYGIDLFASTSG